MSSESLSKAIKTNGDEISLRADRYGRGLSNDFYLRGITASANAVVTRGVETTILAGDANNIQDIVMVTGINTSTNAVAFSLRSGTGGTILDTISVPAAGANGATATAFKNYWPALSQSEIAQAWTAQLTNSGEISDSPLTVSIQAIKNPDNT